MAPDIVLHCGHGALLGAICVRRSWRPSPPVYAARRGTGFTSPVMTKAPSLTYRTEMRLLSWTAAGAHRSARP